MDKNIIKKHLSFLTEEKALGLTNTEKVQKDEESVNKEYYKDVEKKMSDYNKSSKQEGSDSIEPVKYENDESQEEYHNDMEIRNGMEMLQYNDVPEAFKDRNEMYIAGDSKTGNKTYTGKWNPETGEGNGNTESVWGASNDNFGQELIDTIRRAAGKRDKAITPLVQFGDDIEVLPKDTKTIGDARKVALEGIKRLKFKKEFNGLENALKLIPEGYRVDNKVFEITDGNENYKIRWEGNLSEGKAVVLRASNQTLINEDINKMKHLMGFKSNETLGRLDAGERLNENSTFSEIWDKTKTLINGDLKPTLDK